MENNKLSDPSKNNPFEYTHFIVSALKAVPREESAIKVISYIERKEYVSILAPRQTGKTTFLYQIRRMLKDRGRDNIYIDFERNSYNDFKEMIDDFSQRIRENYTDIILPELGDSQLKFINFLKELAKLREVVFLIDEVCSAKNVACEFLKSIRAYYNESIVDGSDSIHKFVFAGSKDLAEFTHEYDPYPSPFNIAQQLYLEDFKMEEIRGFIKRTGNNEFSEGSIQQIFSYTNGHPYLVQFLFYHLYNCTQQEMEKKLKDVPALLDEFKIEDTPNIKNMVDQVWNSNHISKEMVDLLWTILNGGSVRFSESHKRVRNLYLTGCIRRDKEGYCTIRNPIYESVFRKNFEINTKLRQKREEEEAKKERRHFEEYFRKLMNFDGWITVFFTDENTSISPGDRSLLETDRIALQRHGDKNLYVLKEKSNYTLSVTISTFEPRESKDLTERLLIEDGKEADEPVEFRVRPESFYNLGFGRAQSRNFPLHIGNTIQTYDFPINTKEKTREPIQVFINFFQNVSLVKIIKLLVKID